jgi:hypothetical protein
MLDVKEIVKGEFYKVDDNWKGGRWVKALEDGKLEKWPLIEWVIDGGKQRLPLTFLIRKATKKDFDDIFIESLGNK